MSFDLKILQVSKLSGTRAMPHSCFLGATGHQSGVILWIKPPITLHFSLYRSSKKDGCGVRVEPENLANVHFAMDLYEAMSGQGE